MEKRLKGNADLVIFCHGRYASSDEFDAPGSEIMFTYETYFQNQLVDCSFRLMLLREKMKFS